ncbi:site-specific integrase [Schinkia azotoformans]|uniref:site-specific integrase n=1 Tax=Schinkia azotoformans TaxID=1454 RepID=UPI002DB6B6CC|nr:site-specific integrase [Schinkia azotoformans]MEC1744133.1 site-specific integrase [Schinkia azotoformans]
MEPIRDKVWLDEFTRYFEEQNQRDYVLFMTGIHTGLRISDILKLRVRDIEGTHLMIEEQKTGKYKRILITPQLRRIFDEYCLDKKRTDLLFPSRKRSRTGKAKAIDRTTAYKILRKAANDLEYTEPFGTHSLRKTFGYRFYQKYKDVGALQKLFNHDSQTTTLYYIGAAQDDLDDKMAHLY